MAVTQLTAFLENSPGALYKVVDAISKAGIHIRALSVAETSDFGILRFIVSDIEKAKEALQDHIMVTETPVVVVKMNDQTESLTRILKVLMEAEENIEYFYAFTAAVRGNGYVALRVDDVERSEKFFKEKGITTLNDDDLKASLS